MSVATQLSIDPETTIIAAIQQYGGEYNAPELVTAISERTGLPERVVRGVIWDLLAQSKLALTSQHRIVLT